MRARPSGETARDVFYVTDQAGKKLSDHAQLERVRAGVEEAVEQFLVIKAA